MRKLFLFAITAILITPNAHAEVGVTGGDGWTYSCMLYTISDSPSSLFREDTSLGTDTTGCTSTKFLHWTRRNLQNASQISRSYKEYCTACNSNYRLVETTGTSAGCKVTWTYCQPICANHARAKPVGLLIRMLRPIIIRLCVSGVQPPVPTNAVFVAMADITALTCKGVK